MTFRLALVLIGVFVAGMNFSSAVHKPETRWLHIGCAFIAAGSQVPLLLQVIDVLGGAR